ncbi:MAG TPA: ATP-binding protein [Xanthobacteraceae bacterium]|nr:ATP-binding protein [Xanthobacteraceae bacterium]
MTRRLTIRPEFAQLAAIADWVKDFVRAARLPCERLFAIQLCVEEAVANIIMHSDAAEHDDDIAVELAHGQNHVLATIADRGDQFDPTGSRVFRKPASIDEAAAGHFGIHLMRSFADEMRYERRDGWNRLTLRFGPGQGP